MLIYVASALESAQAHLRSRISYQDLQAAKKKFSEGRLKDLSDEYSDNYPRLGIVLSKFYGLGTQYTVAAIDDLTKRLLLDDEIKDGCQMEPPRLLDIARRLGYTHTKRLYNADRSLCEKINGRFRESSRHYFCRKKGTGRRCDPAQVKKALENALKSSKVISLHRVALDLGYASSGTIQKLFPDLYTACCLKNNAKKLERHIQMRRGLEESLQEEPAPSLGTILRRLGYSTSSVLIQNEPTLADEIAARYRRSFRERGVEPEKKAAPMLVEDPPPTLDDVCLRLGTQKAIVSKYAPALQKRISWRRREWVSNETKCRHRRLFQDMCEIARELDSQGVFPSLERILNLLPPGPKAGWNVLNEMLHEVQTSCAHSPLLRS